MSSQSLNCSWTYQSWKNSSYNDTYLGWKPEVTANPDVAGTGVLIGFVGSGYLCWVILFVYYLLVYNPKEGSLSKHANPIDVWILDWFRNFARGYSYKWGAGLEKCVLMLSDQQIVTGIAILGGAYSQLTSDFQIYHWQISIWLAWFSSTTHLATLSVLRNYLQEHPALRTQRLLLMLVVAIMLVVSFLPTGSSAWLQFEGEQTACYFQSLSASWKATGPARPRNNGFLVITTIVILATSYLIRLIKLFPKASMYTRRYVRVKPGKQIKLGLDFLLTTVESIKPEWSQWLTIIFYNPALAGFLIARITFDLIESMLWEVLWLMYALLWASIRLFSLRQAASSFKSQENIWSFGQWVPTLLLAIPIFSIIEICHEACKTPERAPGNRSQETNDVRENSYTEDQGLSPLTQATTSTAVDSIDSTGAESGPTLDYITAAAHGQALYLKATPPHEDDFYQYPWFFNLALLLLTSTLATSALVFQWATSTFVMGYFIGGFLPSIGILWAYFHVPPIFVYPLLFIRTRNSVSVAEWLVQKVCNGRSMKTQKAVLVRVSVVALFLGQFVIVMQFYFLDNQ